MKDNKKGCFVTIIVNLVFIPCLIAVIVSFALEAYVSVAVSFILLLILPQITNRIVSRKLFDQKVEQTTTFDYGRIERFVNKKALWTFGSVAFVLSSLTGFAYLSTLNPKPSYPVAVTWGIIITLNIFTVCFAVGVLLFLKVVLAKAYGCKKHEESQPVE